ncbi:MAG: AraC family transcriptional regulator [Bacteroidota bacterium]|nr:AraC family transcriptional regulator [Bacteroidota bacterium]
MVVQNLFESIGYPPVHIELGQVETEKPVTEKDLVKIQKSLIGYGFEMIDDKTSVLIEKIKTLIIEMVHYKNEPIHENYSTYIESKLHKDYNYLSNLFSDVTGITIERYIINQKIERVKELLVYDELTLSEIAYELGYSSVAYLSGQFKKVTGFTPSHFKQIKENKRKPLDQV